MCEDGKPCEPNNTKVQDKPVWYDKVRDALPPDTRFVLISMEQGAEEGIRVSSNMHPILGKLLMAAAVATGD